MGRARAARPVPVRVSPSWEERMLPIWKANAERWGFDLAGLTPREISRLGLPIVERIAGPARRWTANEVRVHRHGDLWAVSYTVATWNGSYSFLAFASRATPHPSRALALGEARAGILEYLEPPHAGDAEDSPPARAFRNKVRAWADGLGAGGLFA